MGVSKIDHEEDGAVMDDNRKEMQEYMTMRTHICDVVHECEEYVKNRTEEITASRVRTINASTILDTPNGMTGERFRTAQFEELPWLTDRVLEFAGKHIQTKRELEDRHRKVTCSLHIVTRPDLMERDIRNALYEVIEQLLRKLSKMDAAELQRQLRDLEEEDALIRFMDEFCKYPG